MFAQAHSMGLNPAWLTRPGGTFVVFTDEGEKYVNGPLSSLNSQVSSSLSKNKLLTRVILERNGFKNIPYANPSDYAEAVKFMNTNGTIVAKPLKGQGCEDIRIIDNPDQLSKLDIRKYILEKYISGPEIRYLIINHEVVAVHQSDYGTSVDIDRPLKRISFHVSEWDQAMCVQAVAISKLFGLGFSAVDFIVDAQGESHFLEVNSAPGLKWFHAPSEGPPVDVARILLDSYIK